MVTFEKAILATLPDGSCLKINGNNDVGNGEQSFDISLVEADGHEEILCAVDYGKDIGLVISVFGKDGEEAIFKHKVEKYEPFPTIEDVRAAVVGSKVTNLIKEGDEVEVALSNNEKAKALLEHIDEHSMEFSVLGGCCDGEIC